MMQYTYQRQVAMLMGRIMTAHRLFLARMAVWMSNISLRFDLFKHCLRKTATIRRQLRYRNVLQFSILWTALHDLGLMTNLKWFKFVLFFNKVFIRNVREIWICMFNTETVTKFFLQKLLTVQYSVCDNVELPSHEMKEYVTTLRSG